VPPSEDMANGRNRQGGVACERLRRDALCKRAAASTRREVVRIQSAQAREKPEQMLRTELTVNHKFPLRHRYVSPCFPENMTYMPWPFNKLDCYLVSAPTRMNVFLQKLSASSRFDRALQQ